MRLPMLSVKCARGAYARRVLLSVQWWHGTLLIVKCTRGAYLCARSAVNYRGRWDPACGAHICIHDWDAESFVTASRSRGEEPVSGDSNLRLYGNASDQNDVSHKKDHWFLGETFYLYIEFLCDATAISQLNFTDFHITLLLNLMWHFMWIQLYITS
jgi:hypothetical protein